MPLSIFQIVLCLNNLLPIVSFNCHPVCVFSLFSNLNLYFPSLSLAILPLPPLLIPNLIPLSLSLDISITLFLLRLILILASFWFPALIYHRFFITIIIAITCIYFYIYSCDCIFSIPISLYPTFTSAINLAWNFVMPQITAEEL